MRPYETQWPRRDRRKRPVILSPASPSAAESHHAKDLCTRLHRDGMDWGVGLADTRNFARKRPVILSPASPSAAESHHAKDLCTRLRRDGMGWPILNFAFFAKFRVGKLT